MEERRHVKKSTNLKSWVDWNFFAHSCYNYERLQSVGFAQCMYHPLRDLYDTKEEIARELEKHLTFFNTNPVFGNMINGVVIAMEEERANTGGPDSPVTAESIIAFKTGLMGPFAGLGDTVGQGILSPLFLSISITMAEQGNMFAPWFNLICMGSINLIISYVTWMYGYRFGIDAIEKILAGGLMDKVMLFTGILGCLVLGGLAASQVKVVMPIRVMIAEGGIDAMGKYYAPNYMVLQTDLFDALFKNLLSLGTVMAVLLMMRKGMTPLKIICIVSVFAFVTGAIGLFSNALPEAKWEAIDKALEQAAMGGQ